LILPYFVGQAKSCWLTAFGEKNCHSISPTFCLELWPYEIHQINAPFTKSVLRLPNPIHQKSFSTCSFKKVWHK
jgi:hypothetical protein